MCGISGCVSPSLGADELERVAAGMADELAHRGPDDRGVWAEPDSGLALGHRRLAVIDLSSCGHQPMISTSGRFVITYNGEIYNHRALAAELSEGVRFRGHSDTEVMLASIEKWGLDEALRRFVGMFAFALWDRSERRLHLVCDRFGKKPLYYGWSNGSFLFGSELDALSKHPHSDREIDREALALFVRFGYVPAPFS